MKVVILCGGYGTRIRDVTDAIPKPMIEIGPYPILFHIMKYYASFGHKEFILCLGYKSHVVKDFFLNLRSRVSDVYLDLENGEQRFFSDPGILDWKITLAETGLNTMTGGRVKKIKKYIGDDENFMLTYGDGVGNINIDQLIRHHKDKQKILTVTGVRPPGRFGELNISPESYVLEFNEKPQSAGGRISGGYFVCNRKIFDYIPDDDSCVFEQDPVKTLASAKQMTAFTHDDFWQPMDTSREFALLNDLYARGAAPWVR